jgi:2-polyprenyl-3-methyl-5-hydroxy-6-metoxy-1,4-benzoquinol methylase
MYTNGRNDTVNIYMKTATVIDRARSELVKDAISMGNDYILFLDSDIIMPPGAIEKLIDMDVDIASGLYFAKGKPYLPVARLEKDGKHFFLEDFEYNDVIDVAGVGMGLCLIKASVFEKLKYPYFKFDWVDDGVNPIYECAEDLYFCDKAREAGFKIKLNTGVVCHHEGIPCGPEHFNIYKQEIKRDKEDREELFEDLCEFEGVEMKEIENRIKFRKELRNKEFEEIVGEDRTPEKLDTYYKKNNYEIYDHFSWHLEGRRPFDKKLLEEIKTFYPDKSTEILDYGCGGGQIAYMLAQEGYQVTVMDKNEKALNFISFRHNKHKVKIKKVPLPLNPKFKNQYDVILCFDVLEHIPDEEFDEVINTLKSFKKPKAKFYATVSFGAENAQPSHFQGTEEKKKLILDLVK